MNTATVAPRTSRPAKPGMAKRQSDVLAFVTERLQQKSPAPSVREICAHFGWASPQMAQACLDALHANGSISRESHKARTLSVNTVTIGGRTFRSDNLRGVAIPVDSALLNCLKADGMCLVRVE